VDVINHQNPCNDLKLKHIARKLTDESVKDNSHW